MIDKKGFTLIELLVVIALIALLLTILLPSLQLAKSQTRTMVCRSNLRQLVISNLGYATENDEHYVPGAADMMGTDPAASNLRRWHGTRNNVDEPFDASRGPLKDYLMEGQIKKCLQQVKFAEGNPWDANFEQGCGGYGYNMTYLGSRLWDKASDYSKMYTDTTRVTQVRSPAGTLMFADCAMSKEDGSYIEYSFAEAPFTVFMGRVMTGVYMSPSIHFRHRDRANVGWADGHAGSREMAEFEEDNVYGVQSAQMKIGWLDPVDNSLFDLK